MNIKTILSIATIAIIVTLSFSVFYLKGRVEVEQKNNAKLQTELSKLNVSYSELAKSFFNLSKQKTYSISLAPNINSKISSTFGTSKNLTFQYYFTMDGNKLEILPDSSFILKK